MSKHAAKRSHPGLRHTVDSFLSNAFIENIVLVQALGICPIIAAGITLKNGVALSACTAIIMIPTSLIAATKAFKIPKWFSPVLYVLVAAILLLGAAFLLEHFISPVLYARLYLFIPLMAVNMLYTRGLTLASVATAGETIGGALGSAVGFGIVMCFISALRELFIYGSLWDKPIENFQTYPEVAAPFAAFILLGFMSAFLQWLRHRVRKHNYRKEENGLD